MIRRLAVFMFGLYTACAPALAQQVPHPTNGPPSSAAGHIPCYSDIFGTQLSDCGGGTWPATLATTPIGGGDGVLIGGDTAYASGLILGNPNAVNAGLAAPYIPFMVGVETPNGVTGSTPRAFEFFAVNNPSGTGAPQAWGAYGEGHRLKSTTGTTQALELQSRESGNLVTSWNPFNLNPPGTPGSVPLTIGCGAGLSATGLFDCAAVAYVAANPKPFAAGLIFANGSIDSTGPGSSKPAIEMPSDYSIQWWNLGGTGTIAAQIHSDAFNNLVLTPAAGGAVLMGSPMRLAGPYTVATLPTCNAVGLMAAVTDALTPTYGAVAVGGGTISTPVYCTGASWTTH